MVGRVGREVPVGEQPTAEQRRVLEAIAPMAQERMIVLSEAVGLLRFLFVDEVEIEPAAAGLAARRARRRAREAASFLAWRWR